MIPAWEAIVGEFDDTTSVLRAQVAAPVETSRSPCFVVIAGKEVGKLYKLSAPEVVIGRVGGGAAIEVPDQGVSRQHAKIKRNPDGSISICDLESTNGTFCNGERISLRALSDGDRVQIGTTTILKFSMQDALEEDFLRQQYESATRDELTGCFNKKYFLERLAGDLAFARRHHSTLSLAMIDIDRFKNINDSYGHLAGDNVLRTLGQVLAETIRAEDVLARVGGEEFALIMRTCASAEAGLALERIRRRIASTDFVHDGKKMEVTVSAGIATRGPDGPESSEALLEAADKLLYLAKKNGRDRVELG
jgi:two-component system, cell cycle response regulator